MSVTCPLIVQGDSVLAQRVSAQILIGERERANLVARYPMFIADDVALAVIFYLFLNIRQTITRGDKSYGQAQGQASGPGSAFMPAVNAFMQPINAFMQALLPPRGGDQRVHAASYQRRMLVLGPSLRTVLMPKQHSVTCLVQ